jgi:hypothetical protein
MGWMYPQYSPWPPNDPTPLKPSERPQGPASGAISYQAGLRWLTEQGMWPPAPDAAYVQLAELRARQARSRRNPFSSYNSGTPIRITSAY